MLIFVFIAIFTTLFLFAYLEDYIEKEKWYAYIVICILLVLNAGLRPIGCDPDSINYENAFFNFDNQLLSLNYEASFLTLCKIGYSIVSDVHIVFLFYAMIAIPLRFLAIKKLTPYLFSSLIIYFGNFYILHDYTQLRVSIASSLFLLSIPYICEENKKKAFVLMLCALIFHYSSLVLFIILFLSNKPLNIKWRIGLASIIPIGIATLLLKVDLITVIPIPYIQDKIEAYRKIQEYTDMFEEVSLVNAFLWIKIILFLYAIYFYDTISQQCKYLPLLLKIMGASIFAFFGFSQLPVISGRISELFGIIEIVFYPYVIMTTIKPKYISTLLVCLLAFIEFAFNLFIWKLLDFTSNTL